jgi:hypothetical protein
MKRTSRQNKKHEECKPRVSEKYLSTNDSNTNSLGLNPAFRCEKTVTKRLNYDTAYCGPVTGPENLAVLFLVCPSTCSVKTGDQRAAWLDGECSKAHDIGVKWPALSYPEGFKWRVEQTRDCSSHHKVLAEGQNLATAGPRQKMQRDIMQQSSY